MKSFQNFKTCGNTVKYQRLIITPAKYDYLYSESSAGFVMNLARAVRVLKFQI